MTCEEFQAMIHSDPAAATPEQLIGVAEHWRNCHECHMLLTVVGAISEAESTPEEIAEATNAARRLVTKAEDWKERN